MKQDVAEVKMSIYTKGPSFTTRRRLISVWTVSLLGMVCEKMTERVEVLGYKKRIGGSGRR